MKRNRKTGITVLLVIIGLVVLASVALRMILTRDRLVAMIVPRIEKAVDAKIDINDIGIRFPFGFGVDVSGLSFEKKMPGTGNIRFESEKVVVNVSMMSLIRRKPEIEKVLVSGGSLRLSGLKNGMDLDLLGLAVEMSLSTADSTYLIDTGVSIASVEAVVEETGGKFVIEDIGISGSAEADMDFNSITIRDGSVSLQDIVRISIQGELNDLKGGQEFSFRIDSDDIAIEPLLEWVFSLDLDVMVPPMRGKKPEAELPFAINGGSIELKAKLAGSVARLSDNVIKGSIDLKDIAVKPEDIGIDLVINGSIEMSNESLSSEKVTVSFGKSSLDTGFDITLDAGMRPEHIDFKSELDADVGDLASRVFPDTPGVGGGIKVKIIGSGRPATLGSLFPGGLEELSAEAIARAWKNVRLTGEIELSGIEVSPEGSPVRISALHGKARIENGDIRDVRAGFDFNGSPYEATVDLKGIMPAMAELIMLIEKAGKTADLADILDSVKNVPDVSVRLTGRSFDIRPFEKLSPEQGDKQSSPPAGREDKTKSDTAALAAIPGVVLMLLDTRLSAGIDSVITEKALFTSVSAEGRIQKGRMSIDPVSFDYTGGKGHGTAGIDLRDLERINSKFNISFSDIEIGQALGRFHSMGTLVSGRFSFKARGGLVNGPGIDPLTMISASGNASSEKGRLDLSRFVSPVSGIAGMNLSKLEKIDFHKWTGNFHIENGRLGTDDWKIRSANGNWDIRGSFGFDGTLAYKARLLLTPAMQKSMKDLDKYRDIVDLFRDDKGNLILDFDIGGTSESPKVHLDQSKAEKKAKEKLIDGLKKGVGDKLKDLWNKSR